MEKEIIARGNKFMVGLLRSPFHTFISNNTLVLTYSGCKTGHRYATPMNYVQDDDTYIVTSLPGRIWWRNLVSQPNAAALVQGHRIDVIPSVVQDPGDVKKKLEIFFTLAPSFAKYFKVQIDRNGIINEADLDRASKERVIILLKAKNSD